MVINNINRLSSTSTSQDTLNALFSPSNWRSMFIGKAGAGKTYTLRQANDNYMIELLAPSNLAAWQLGGKTLCKFLGLEELTPDTLLGINENKIRNYLIGIAMDPSYLYRGVYIDEMSFFNVQTFEFIDGMFERINAYLQVNNLPLIHLIWGGDYLQLRTIGGKPIYMSPLLSKYSIVITPNVYRQTDPTWLECLSAVREGRIKEVKDYFSNPQVQRNQISTTLIHPTCLGPYGIHIVGTNDDVIAQAAIDCLEISNTNKTPRYSFWNGYKSTVSKNKNIDPLKPQKKDKNFLHLTKGIRVKASDKGNGIVKGQYGTVLDCGPDRVDVKFDKGIEHTYRYDGSSKLDLKPGGVATVYSVQGITIPEGSIAMVNINATFAAKPKGSLYVMLSRSVEALGTCIICNKWSEIERWIDVDRNVIAMNLF